MAEHLGFYVLIEQKYFFDVAGNQFWLLKRCDSSISTPRHRNDFWLYKASKTPKPLSTSRTHQLKFHHVQSQELWQMSRLESRAVLVAIGFPSVTVGIGSAVFHFASDGAWKGSCLLPLMGNSWDSKYLKTFRWLKEKSQLGNQDVQWPKWRWQLLYTNSLISLGTATVGSIRGYFETFLNLFKKCKDPWLGLFWPIFCKSTALYEASGGWAPQLILPSPGLNRLMLKTNYFCLHETPGKLIQQSRQMSDGFPFGFQECFRFPASGEQRCFTHVQTQKSHQSSQVMKKDTSEAREMKPQTCRETNILSQRNKRNKNTFLLNLCSISFFDGCYWFFIWPGLFDFHLDVCCAFKQMWFLEPGPRSFLGRFSIHNRRLLLSQGVQWSCLSEGAAWMKRSVAFWGGWCLQRAGVFGGFWFWSFTSWCWQC